MIGAQCVDGLVPGVYHYDPAAHAVDRTGDADLRSQLAAASLRQTWMARAPVSLVITSEYARICGKYGERGIRYAMIEAGHVGQNIFLQAQALGLAAGIVGAFDDERLIDALQIPADHRPLLVMPVGYPA